ncbi:ferredoxin--NADP reductase [Antrihabitans sp. YC2-6]|uniref:ferredoxin--NADP reductase n=1 Tax=Antrihabitans sp. YC2-6 TaxID=2799498 RepID=UPI0018F3432D|nr:ferredoxin--NADP reductase [Antrihabitans sp. YC2-6]MBJ8344805.1 ferredoxin--NADP reductase [Antrihabitans sp. YC2-6]
MSRNAHVHTLEVVEVIKETDEAASLVFTVPDRLVDDFRYHPGQFLTLEIPSKRTGSVARCYSLSSSPHLDDELIVTVKRTAGGYASNWLCDNVAVGTALRVLRPSGVFVPKSLDADLLLLAAGSGITPIMSIAKSALLGGTGTVYLIYANAEAGAVIFGAELAEMIVEFPDRFQVVHWLASERGLPTVDGLSELLLTYEHYDTFVCGPAPFMAVCRAALREIGTPDKHVHVEKFQSLTGDPFADISVPNAGDAESATATVAIDGRSMEVDWPRETPLLDVLLARGIDAPYSCRAGECSACACTVRSGEVRMLKNDTLVDADLALGLTLACQAVPVSDRLDIAFDQ